MQRHPQTGKLLLDETTGKPLRVEGIENHYINSLEEHPFWTLMRDDHLPIGLMSDDPQQGGMDYKDQVKLLAGIGKRRNGVDPVDASVMQPLTAEELTLCNLNALQVAFCAPEVKTALAANIAAWAKEHNVHVEHPLLAEGRLHHKWQQRVDDPHDGHDGWSLGR